MNGSTPMFLQASRSHSAHRIWQLQVVGTMSQSGRPHRRLGSLPSRVRPQQARFGVLALKGPRAVLEVIALVPDSLGRVDS